MSGPWEKYRAPVSGPWVKYASPQARAQADAQQNLNSAGYNGRDLSVFNGYTFNHLPDVRAVGAAAQTGVQNLFGRGPGYGMADAYRATKATAQRAIDAYANAHPTGGLVANVAGAAVNPASLVGGEWVGAARGMLGASARAAALGGAEGGAAGGPKGAAMGAALGPVAPVLGGVAMKGVNAASAIGRNVQRVAGLANPTRVAARRLSAAVAKDISAGADPVAASAAFQGVSAPTLADVGGENVRSVIRDAGTQGPARQVLAQYQKKVGANLKDNALALTRALPPTINDPVPAIRAALDQHIANAATPPITAEPGSGGQAISQALNDRAAQAKQAVDDAYSAARDANPEQAHLDSAALPPLASAVRNAVSDFSPRDVPRVTGNLADLDALSTPTARDLFEIRSRLSNLRAGNDPVEAKAAGQAVRALDGQIDGALADGKFGGDPSVVGLWKNANALRRQYGQQFEGGDLIHDLTEQTFRGGNRILAIAPEDASSVILGRNGVNPRQNFTRDFSRVTDLLGQDHPAVTALRNEAASRLLSADAGTPDYGTALQGFRGANPSLAKVLLPDLSDHLASSRAAIDAAMADRASLDAGGAALTAPPDAYAASFGAISPNTPMAQAGARQALIDSIGRPTEGAIGTLNRISTATNPGENLSATFGDDAANAYRGGLGDEVNRVENANWMAPQLGSKTFSSAQDGHGLMHIGGMALGLVKRAVGGGPLTDAERSALVDAGVGDLSPELLNALIKRSKGPPMLPGYQYGVAPVAVTSGQEVGS
jgi:hypothetical protein